MEKTIMNGATLRFIGRWSTFSSGQNSQSRPILSACVICSVICVLSHLEQVCLLTLRHFVIMKRFCERL